MGCNSFSSFSRNQLCRSLPQMMTQSVNTRKLRLYRVEDWCLFVNNAAGKGKVDPGAVSSDQGTRRTGKALRHRSSQSGANSR
jgi:hypothetical protein